MSKSRNDARRNEEDYNIPRASNECQRHHETVRSNVARGMILSGQGRKQVFQDRRMKRSKDRKRSWENDEQSNG
jgi:hypothetical protein